MVGLIRLTDLLCRAGAILAAACLASLFLLGLTEVLLRNLADTSLPFAVEYSGYLVAATLLLGSGEALRTGGHIRVTLVTDRLSPSWALAMELAASLIGLVVAGFFAWALVDYGLGTLAQGTRSYYPSATPLALPQLFMALGPMTLTAAFLGRLARLLTGAPLEEPPADEGTGV